MPWLLTAMLLLGAAPAARGLVLCIGTDGHVELEPAVAGDCDAPSGDAATLAFRTAASGDHCGVCVDVPIPLVAGNGTPVIRTASLQRVPAGLQSAAGPHCARPGARDVATTSPPTVTDGAPAPTAARRVLATVILQR